MRKDYSDNETAVEAGIGRLKYSRRRRPMHGFSRSPQELAQDLDPFTTRFPCRSALGQIRRLTRVP